MGTRRRDPEGGPLELDPDPDLTCLVSSCVVCLVLCCLSCLVLTKGMVVPKDDGQMVGKRAESGEQGVLGQGLGLNMNMNMNMN